VTESRPETGVVEMRWTEFDRLCTLRGWKNDAERARQLGFSDRMLSNMRHGRVRPGLKVVDACLKAFGASMYDVLFQRVADKPSDKDAA
jgi:transcriptional regulator with XRE-family HTH domain